ncbi:MAG: hypothetical protein ABSG93_09345 [Solirubrobacteraceae bacterium]|jgi:hypothetical protein
MATRTIVTSQPDVECDVCARRLLRGEQPDVFVGAGRRRIVCELCAPRAAHEGWMRETDSQSLTLPPLRPRRGRSLFERLRQVGRPPGDAQGGLVAAGSGEEQAEPYDLFADSTPAGAQSADAASVQQATSHTQPVAATPPEAPAADLGEASYRPVPARETETPPSETHAAPEQPSEYVQQAIAVFNASEFPRRVAGVTRSLGAPAVTVRSAEHLESVVSIVVAWELCWYRYEVDLSEPVVEAQVIAQGTELSELAREDRLANAAAAESGMLLLAGA